jgi:hypothetical protein
MHRSQISNIWIQVSLLLDSGAPNLHNKLTALGLGFGEAAGACVWVGGEG